MTEVILNNVKHHQQEAMIDWCKRYIGSGGWSENWPRHENSEQWVWVMKSSGGTLTFKFYYSEDALVFKKQWSIS